MSKYDLQSLIPDYGDFSPEDIWTGSTAAETAPAAEPAPHPAPVSQPEESLAERSRREAMSTFGETLRQYQKSDDPAPPPPQPQDEDVPAAIGVSATGETQPAEPEKEPEPQVRRPRITRDEDGIITIHYDAPPEEEPEEDSAADEDTYPETDSAPEDESPEDESPDDGEAAPEDDHPARRRRSRPDPSALKDKILTPFTLIAAGITVRRAMGATETAKYPEPEEEELPPEIPLKKAAKFYSSQAKALRFRCRIAFFLTLILAWIGFQFPMAGLLGKSLHAQASVSLVLTLAVMISALDVFTAGCRQLIDMKPGAESLAALAAIFSCVDCTLVISGHGSALPFCAAASAALTAALWGHRLTCTALRRTFSSSAVTKNPSVLVQEETENGEPGIFLRSVFNGQSIIRRSEQPDVTQTVYAAAAPVFMIFSLILAILACIGGEAGQFLHILSALLTVSAAISAFIVFPLPYAIASARLRDLGAALLGWNSFAAIGRRRRVVITDEDLFPAGTIRLTGVNIQDGYDPKEIMSYTISLLSASGSGVTSAFDDMMEHMRIPLVDVDGYRCHEGGGLSAVIDRQRVLVGSANYMTLMGIRLPGNLEARNTICTAIDGTLVGVSALEYIPLSSVQDALVTLLRGRTQAIFAIRDFNITPLMMRQLFRIPTENLNFPSFRERYRLAGTVANPKTKASVVFARGGMMPLVETTETARRIFAACRIGAIVSVIGSVLGMLILFLLFRTGAFDTATAGNVLAYMLLWTLPVIILSLGQSR